MHALAYNKSNDKTTEMNSLTACMNKAVRLGYNQYFKVSSPCLYSEANKTYYMPNEVKVNNFYRFEGESDPADSAILYAIETKDGLKGILIDAYGIYADEDVSTFITRVQEVNKKVVGNN